MCNDIIGLIAVDWKSSILCVIVQWKIETPGTASGDGVGDENKISSAGR